MVRYPRCLVKGVVRNPIVSWLVCFVPCVAFFWIIYLYYTWLNELKVYLEDADLNPVMELALCLIPFYSLYLIYKMGGLIQRAQQKAGVSDAQDQGVMFILFNFLCGFGVYKIQDELNKAWA